jgi:hypothetical protein
MAAPIISDSHKACTRCGKWKPLDAFPLNLNISTGLSSSCRECQCEATRRWRARNRDYDREYRKRNPDKVAAYNAKRRKAP